VKFFFISFIFYSCESLLQHKGLKCQVTGSCVRVQLAWVPMFMISQKTAPRIAPLLQKFKEIYAKTLNHIFAKHALASNRAANSWYFRGEGQNWLIYITTSCVFENFGEAITRLTLWLLLLVWPRESRNRMNPCRHSWKNCSS